MSEFDMMLARGVNDGYINLAIGEAHVLQRNLVLPSRKTTRGENEYPAPQGDPMLIKEIQNLNPGAGVVVANGAKQALLATLYAYSKFFPKKKRGVLHTDPYWPSFPTLSKMQELQFKTSFCGYLEDFIYILTLPNNPSGYELGRVPAFCDIWDAAYAQPVYGFDNRDTPAFGVKVESASKMFGLSGARIGWLVTYIPEIVHFAAEYVELNTSGVNVPSQRKVAACLANMDKLQKGFDKARRELLINADIFHQELGGFIDKVDGVPKNGTGMFAFFNVFPDVALQFEAALETAKVRLIKGEACGRQGWWRMSMAQDPDLTYQALNSIKKAIHG